MIDPRVVLVIGALYLTVMGVHKAVSEVRHLGHAAKTAVHHILHPSGRDIQ